MAETFQIQDEDEPQDDDELQGGVEECDWATLEYTCPSHILRANYRLDMKSLGYEIYLDSEKRIWFKPTETSISEKQFWGFSFVRCRCCAAASYFQRVFAGCCPVYRPRAFCFASLII
jgi:hypothetical protein